MVMRSLRHLSRALLLLMAFAAFGTQHEARAQNFPNGTIRIIAPVSVSTPPDILARIIANALSDNEGWKVVVEDKPGGVMSIGAMEVLKQPADGQTILSVILAGRGGAGSSSECALSIMKPTSRRDPYWGGLQRTWSSIRPSRSTRYRSWSRI